MADKDVVILNAGHGGKDPGAVAKDGTEEKRVNLEITKETELAFNRYCPRLVVELTRRHDTYMTLSQIVKYANNWPGVLCFLSIHANANVSRRPQGVELYYYSQEGKRLAEAIGSRLYGKERILKNTFYVIKKTNMVANLGEVGYMTHGGDLSLMKRPAIQRIIGRGFAEGILDWAGIKYGGEA